MIPGGMSDLVCHDVPSDDESADWCAPFDDGVICGTRMVEHSRTSRGIKWCFRCRKRVEFQFVVMVPDGPSYYGPTGWMECPNCRGHETDLFPGWFASTEYE